jgi:tetratricopeptide (TPR) repeat protein
MSIWDNPGEMLARAQTARAQGDRDLAYQMFARASELSPQDANAWQGRAETTESPDEALVSYAYASALDANNRPLARTLDAAVAQRAAGAEKDDVGLLVALGQELAEVGLTDRAQTLFQRAAELDPASADAWVWLAGMSRDGEVQAEYLNRALAINPLDSRARAGLLVVKPSTVSSPPPSSKTGTTAARDPLESNDLNEVLAHAALTDDLQLRERLYLRALDLDPDNAQARDGMALLRVKRLRDTARIPAPHSEAPYAGLRAATNTSDTRLRNILLLLIAIVLILAIAGAVLMLTQ